MNRRFREQINEEINQYKSALLYFANVCDWKSFESRAATLFDYLESIEVSLLKNKLHQAMTIILIAFLLAIVILGQTELTFFIKYQSQIILTALAAIVIELLLLGEMRLYLNVKIFREKKRKGQFIRNIEDDFKAGLRTEPCSAGKQHP